MTVKPIIRGEWQEARVAPAEEPDGAATVSGKRVASAKVANHHLTDCLTVTT